MFKLTHLIEGVEGIVNSVDIPTRATGSKATRTAEAFVRSLIQSSNAEAYSTLAQAIASASVPEYEKITCPLLCVAGQEDQVARLEDLALIGDRHVPFSTVPTSTLLYIHSPCGKRRYYAVQTLQPANILHLQLGSTLKDRTRGSVRRRTLALHRGCGRNGRLPQEVCQKGRTQIARFLETHNTCTTHVTILWSSTNHGGLLIYY